MSQDILNPLRTRDSTAYYLGNLASQPGLMVGKLALSSKYLTYHIYDIYAGGLLQAARLSSVGRVLALPLDRIVDVSVEKGVRSRKSRPNWKDKADFEKKVRGERPLNIPAGALEASERFSQLMITVETDNGVEVAVFEVENVQSWEQALRGQLSRQRAVG